MPKILSATDAVSPAFDQTKHLLFQPFRFSFWARMAVVALTTGEFSGTGGWSRGNISIPAGSSGRRSPGFIRLPVEIWQHWHRYLPYILIGAAVLLALLVVWVYMASVFRFILFESVLTGRCDIKEGWRRWRSPGVSYFLWQVGLGLVMLAVMCAVILGPLLLAVRAGVFSNARDHILLLVLGGMGLAFLVVLPMAAGAVIALMAKDFVIPVMALEEVRVMEGWRRFLPMLKAEKKAFGGYVLMKIVLAVGCAILFGVLTLIALLVLLIPLGIAGFAIFLIAKGYGLGWSVYTMAVCMAVASAIVALLFYVIAFISTPAMVFFQSYVNHFLGSRYLRLGVRVFPPPSDSAGRPAPEPSPAG